MKHLTTILLALLLSMGAWGEKNTYPKFKIDEPCKDINALIELEKDRMFKAK